MDRATDRLTPLPLLQDACRHAGADPLKVATALGCYLDDTLELLATIDEMADPFSYLHVHDRYDLVRRFAEAFGPVLRA